MIVMMVVVVIVFVSKMMRVRPVRGRNGQRRRNTQRSKQGLRIYVRIMDAKIEGLCQDLGCIS